MYVAYNKLCPPPPPDCITEDDIQFNTQEYNEDCLRSENFLLKGNFTQIVEQIYNLQSIYRNRLNQQSIEDIKRETEPYFKALWNDLRDTGGKGGDDVYGHFFCTGCSSTNSPGFCGGLGCVSCGGSSIDYNFQSGNVSGEVTYDFGGSISCNLSISF